jgi:hypothetical protein
MQVAMLEDNMDLVESPRKCCGPKAPVRTAQYIGKQHVKGTSRTPRLRAPRGGRVRRSAS